MNELTREEKNRKLSEWLGWTQFRVARNGQVFGVPPTGQYISDRRIPNFYAEEEANALLLDKFPEPELWLEDGLWYCQPNYMQDGPDTNAHYILSCDVNRKNCVAEAAFKLIEASR